MKNSLRILLLYKLSDVLLFAAFALANQSGGAIRLSELGHLQDSVGGVCILLVSLALLIKTGGFPFVWLPRAMEGPTPSSAVFYGAIATHVPVGLFAMLWAKGPFPEWVQLVLIAIATIVMGLAMIYSRVEANAKNALAYATVQNLMLIVIEGLLGFSWLAIGHALLHCLYRLAQFMRAPSQLYEHHRSQGFAGRSEPRRRIYESIFPSRVEATLYRWSLHEFYIFPRLVRTLDNLIGISCDLYRRQLIMIVVANCIGIFGLAALEWAGSGLEYQSQVFLLAPAWAFALIALLSDASGPGHLRIVALAVTSLLAAILTFDEWLSLWNYGLIQAGIAYGMRIAIRSAHRGEDGDRHSARRSRLRFAFALLIGGVPGPGTYYLFERAIHLALSVDVPFAIGAFTVLSLITTGVVRNHSLRGIVSRNRPGKNDGAVGIELRSEFGSSARPTRAKPGVATGLRA